MNRLTHLLERYHEILAAAGNEGLARLPRIARLQGALAALLEALQAKPKKLSPSALRTLVQALDLFAVLTPRGSPPHEETLLSPLILALDDDFICRETVCTALEMVQLRAITLGEPAIALQLLEENRFDLIFLDVDMPGLNGFEVCERLRALPANAQTSVVFATALMDFEARLSPAASGPTDFIAKPFLLLELGLKALIHLDHGPLNRP